MINWIRKRWITWRLDRRIRRGMREMLTAQRELRDFLSQSQTKWPVE